MKLLQGAIWTDHGTRWYKVVLPFCFPNHGLLLSKIFRLTIQKVDCDCNSIRVMATQDSSSEGSKELEPTSSQAPSKTKPTSPPLSPRSPEGTPPRAATASPIPEVVQAPTQASTSSAIEVGDGLEPTEEDFEVESADDLGYDDDGSSVDASISSSVRAGVMENGLRYHGFRKDRTYYPFPNDENEQNRDDMKHALMGMVMEGKLHFAPIGDNPQSILDLGMLCLRSRASELTRV